ncbi:MULTISPECIES: hypothetical protein [unclassified Streptomyces]|uniref:hypothetical protein n=1 Tax=unclassified Streptomyces TaxID=2593676 RepID=UPI002255BD9D|nr:MULTISPECIES: hypothetical protein [unclassified Streptomyces]MCX5287097.1 hypothetical protein [Streptomyces sp. NBC_00183]
MIISVATSGGNKKSTPAKPSVTPSAPAPSTTPSAPSTSAPTPVPTPSARPTKPATTVSGDGEYIVGKDIRPGTYRTAGPADSSLPNCYWERDKDAKGEFSSIIANGNPNGSAVVSVQPTDKLFKTQGCKEWVKIG